MVIALIAVVAMEHGRSFLKWGNRYSSSDFRTELCSSIQYTYPENKFHLNGNRFFLTYDPDC